MTGSMSIHVPRLYGDYAAIAEKRLITSSSDLLVPINRNSVLILTNKTLRMWEVISNIYFCFQH